MNEQKQLQEQLQVAVDLRRKEGETLKTERRAADEALAAQKKAAEALVNDPEALSRALLEAVVKVISGSDTKLGGGDKNELRFKAATVLSLSLLASPGSNVFMVDWPAAAQAVMAMGVLPDSVSVECSRSGRCVVKV